MITVLRFVTNYYSQMATMGINENKMTQTAVSKTYES